ncbi:MAG TPA: LamG domain-containing protein [Candidatus Saccharimonadales bacterium]|nr:LamG domain-containing protein [Candidatus Saccharimonadales bacterium]
MKKITLLGVLLTTLAASVVRLNAQSLSGLVSLWHGESNVVDSVSGQNGTLQAQQVSYTAGEVGQAFNISGGIATIPDSTSLEPTNITVQAWVKAASPGAYRYIICKARGAGGVSYAFYTGSTGGAIFFVNLLNGTAGDTFAPSPSAPTTIWDNNWHQLTGTFDGVTSHLYVDGAEVGSGLATTNTNPIDYSSPQPLIFGDYQVARGLPYLGGLDEVKIFGRAL